MAARRGKTQARRNGSNGLPGWAWLVIGILIALLAVLIAPRFLKSGDGDGFLRIGPKPNPDALPAAVDENADAIAPDVATNAPADAAKPKATQYDFYTLLPGEEVAVSDAELAASAKAEADAQARAAQAAKPSTGTDDAAALPKPIMEAPVADNSTTAATKPAETATTTSAPATTVANDARYILQAGAFGASGDAETVKAKIAMLGLNARVESAQIGGKTVYRVRMGPYGSASELAEAKSKLAGGGLPAMAVKTN
ncbi:SPOR domain-containing protein [Thermomonas aquatica]|uniref:Sporulation protein n=1 Tax=Thermomonas aquatica TaxID=2202149 RepID=A0A5B7ZR10_9GAMM|nr:SPOR domain-containing protein [Thermomonas aquatica]QDA57520.1 sporulation protein [Thermomonas aquatica]